MEGWLDLARKKHKWLDARNLKLKLYKLTLQLPQGKELRGY